jgi:O-antigen ligase
MNAQPDKVSFMGLLKEKYAQYHYLFPTTFILLLPFGFLHNIVLGAWLVLFILLGIKKSSLQSIFENKISIISILFFLLYIIYYFFTNNKSEAATAIEIKLSFIIFPVLLMAHIYLPNEIRKICQAFIIGCFTSSVICLLRSTYVYFMEHKNEFFYGNFTIFLHSSYAAMYALLALLLLLSQFQFHYKNKWTSAAINSFIFIILTISIFLYSSKMGIITFLILMPIIALYKLFKNKSYKLTIAILSLGIISSFIANHFIPEPFDRLKFAFQVSSSKETIDKSATESTAVRILIWKEALQIIKTNLWLGVGPGDANETMQSAYIKNDLTGANEKKLNAHNEFLQIGIGLGLLGLLVFIALFLLGFYQSFKDRNILLALFLILIIFNFLVESMLQRQSGVLFFAFFLCLFLHPNFKTTISDKN